MYGNLLYALMDTVAEALGDQWTTDHKQAWDDRLEALLGEIDCRVKAL